MRAINTFFFGILLIFSFENLNAQAIQVSEPMTIRNDYGYEIIGRLKDRILLFRDRADDFEIQAFDPSMRLSWSRKLEDIDKRGTQILAVIGSKNDFSVIFKVRRRGTTVLRLFKYDPGAVLIDSMTIKNYGERLFSPPSLDLVRSEDQKTFAVFNTAERGILEVVCFQLDKMQVLWETTTVLEQDYLESQLKSLQLSNDGSFFAITEYNNRKGKLDRHQFRITKLSQEPSVQFIIPLEEKYTSDVKFIIDNQNKQLVGGGVFSERNRERASGAFYVRQSIYGGKPVLKYTDFDASFMSILRRKDVADDDKGINDADVSHLVLRRDGGLILMVERHHEIQRGAAAGRGFWREGMRVVVDFYFDDLFAVAFDPKGDLLWNTVLHKKQYSQDDEGTYSSYFLLRSFDRLHFMFNDEIKYENTCSEYTLDPTGSFDRNSLLNTFSKSLRLRFRDGIQISDNECIVPSEFRNKLRLVLLQTPG